MYSDKLTRAEALLHELYRCTLKNGGSNQYKVHQPTSKQGLNPIDLVVSWEIRLAGDIARYTFGNGVCSKYPRDPPEDEDVETKDQIDH